MTMETFTPVCCPKCGSDEILIVTQAVHTSCDTHGWSDGSFMGSPPERSISDDVDEQPVLENSKTYLAANDDYSVEYLHDTAKFVCVCGISWVPDKPIEWEWAG